MNYLIIMSSVPGLGSHIYISQWERQAILQVQIHKKINWYEISALMVGWEQSASIDWIKILV